MGHSRVKYQFYSGIKLLDHFLDALGAGLWQRFSALRRIFNFRKFSPGIIPGKCNISSRAIENKRLQVQGLIVIKSTQSLGVYQICHLV